MKNFSEFAVGIKKYITSQYFLVLSQFFHFTYQRSRYLYVCVFSAKL